MAKKWAVQPEKRMGGTVIGAYTTLPGVSSGVPKMPSAPGAGGFDWRMLQEEAAMKRPAATTSKSVVAAATLIWNGDTKVPMPRRIGEGGAPGSLVPGMPFQTGVWVPIVASMLRRWSGFKGPKKPG